MQFPYTVGCVVCFLEMNGEDAQMVNEFPKWFSVEFSFILLKCMILKWSHSQNVGAHIKKLVGLRLSKCDGMENCGVTNLHGAHWVDRVHRLSNFTHFLKYSDEMTNLYQMRVLNSQHEFLLNR